MAPKKKQKKNKKIINKKISNNKQKKSNDFFLKFTKQYPLSIAISLRNDPDDFTAIISESIFCEVFPPPACTNAISLPSF